MAVRRKSLQAALAAGVTLVAGCEPATATKPSEVVALNRPKLSAQVIANTRMNLDDVTERLLPSIGDVRAASELRIHLAEFDARLTLGDPAGAGVALIAAKAAVEALSERTSLGGRESPDVGAIRLVIDQAESSLSQLKEVQK